MQITKISNNKSITKKPETKKSEGSSFSSHLSSTDANSSTSQTSSVSSLMPVDSLLAIQEVNIDQPNKAKQQCKCIFGN